MLGSGFLPFLLASCIQDFVLEYSGSSFTCFVHPHDGYVAWLVLNLRVGALSRSPSLSSSTAKKYAMRLVKPSAVRFAVLRFSMVVALRHSELGMLRES